jgi:hypothetical protein
VDIQKRLSQLKCDYIAYSTFSSDPETKGYSKFRVIIPLCKPFEKNEVTPMKEIIINLIGEPLDYIYGLIDYTSFEMPRMFYVPVNSSPDKINFCLYQQNNNFLSPELLFQWRNQQIMSKSPQWKTIDYIDSSRKNLSF